MCIDSCTHVFRHCCRSLSNRHTCGHRQTCGRRHVITPSCVMVCLLGSNEYGHVSTCATVCLLGSDRYGHVYRYASRDVCVETDLQTHTSMTVNRQAATQKVTVLIQTGMSCPCLSTYYIDTHVITCIYTRLYLLYIHVLSKPHDRSGYSLNVNERK